MPRSDQELFELARKYVEEAELNAMNNPTSDEILVVIVEPSEKPYKKLIPNTLEAMNAIVGGSIELAHFRLGQTKTGANIAITLHSEGKLIGLPMNRRIINQDILVGTFFITAYNMQGDNVSLSEADADRMIKRFTPIEVYM